MRAAVVVPVGVVAGVAGTALFVHATGAYWAYADLGVNPAANRGTLLVVYAPAVLALLLAGGFAALAPVRRASTARACAAIVAAQVALAGAAFALECARTADARREGATVAGFLRLYASRLAAGELAPVRIRERL